MPGQTIDRGRAAADIAALLARWGRSDAPGLTVGVRYDGRLLFRGGFGMASLESPRALDPRSRIRIGSTAKHMTALLALLLAEDGLLDLDAAISTYLPELSGAAGEPTIRELLQHRGGSRDYFDVSVIAHLAAPLPKDRALALHARQQGRNFPRGTAMIYCNGGYHMVSLAIERAGGAPFEEQLAARLFEPLGMYDTVSVQSDYTVLPGVATLHEPMPGGGWRRGLLPTEQVRGEGGVVSTIDDMLRWTAHLLRRDRFGTAESWSALLERPRYPDGSQGRYALGLIHGRHRDRPTLFHAGGVIGGLSQMILFPDDALEIVILANGAPGADPAALALQVADIVLGAEADEKAADPDPAAAALTGIWVSRESGMTYAIETGENGTRLGVCGGPATVPLERSADGRWHGEAVTLSDLAIDAGEAADGALAITFGGVTARYHRRTDVRPASLPAGTFHSHDAECDALFVRDGDRDLLRMRDPIGANESLLDWCGDGMAIATATAPGLPYTAVVTIDADGNGFTINTARTRCLRFERQA